MDLHGKTVVFLGSSVTLGTASGGWSMCEYLAENCECTSVKWAVSGTTLADFKETSYVRRLLEHLPTQHRCDCFICQLSTNDATKRLPLGEISGQTDTLDVQTVFGAMEFIISTVRKTYGCPIFFYTGTRYKNDHYQKMVDGLHRIADKWNIGIIDLWDDPQMNAVTEADYARFMHDPIHPNRLGYELWWGPKFQDVLNHG